METVEKLEGCYYIDLLGLSSRWGSERDSLFWRDRGSVFLWVTSEEGKQSISSPLGRRKSLRPIKKPAKKGDQQRYLLTKWDISAWPRWGITWLDLHHPKSKHEDAFVALEVCNSRYLSGGAWPPALKCPPAMAISENCFWIFSYLPHS